jgi:hypothetical protein
MLVLESTDSEADVADFAQQGIGISPVLPFSRQAILPDGSATTVGFSLVFAKDTLSPDTTFFTCKQQNPAAFWKPDYQQHPNGASVYWVPCWSRRTRRIIIFFSKPSRACAIFIRVRSA